MGIRVEHISKAYEGRPVLQDVSCEIADGAFVTILGPTGEGKTTLLRILAGVERPDAGRVFYDGVDVTRLPVQKRNVAMVYQWFVNYPSLTVFENIASPLRCRQPKVPAAEIERRVTEMATLLRIDKHLHKRPNELSGGQQQRLAIARALAKDAPYVFLDEPLTNLDYKLQEELRAELQGIFARRQRGAVIYASPQPVEALMLSTHVGFMKAGRLAQFGTVEEVYHRPATRDVAKYFSHPSMNILPATRVDDAGRQWLRATEQLRVDVTAFGLPAREYLLGIRAHALTMERREAAMLPVTATVELAEVVGSDTELHLRHEGVPLVAWLQGVGRYGIGDSVTAFVDPQRFFVFDANDGRLVTRTEMRRDGPH
jgi:glycerol transport system ATP-binding protein